jgi:tRNA A-37 threonylcarbamoyl transferase component Bud32
VSLGRLLPEEQQGLREIGVTMEAFVAGLEITALGVLALCLITGVFLFLSRPNSWIAWVTSLFLVTMPITSSFNIDALARAHSQFVPLQQVHGALAMTLPALLLLLFPDGRFVPRWSRWVVLAWGVFLTGQIAAPELLGSLGERTDVAGYVLAMSVYVLGVWAQIRRYRKLSSPLEKQQTKWVVVAASANVAVAVTITVTLQVVPGIFSQPLHNQLYETSMFLLYELGLLFFPVGFLFAILRYRLWDIDFIINRSLVYGALTLFLVGFFAGSVLAVRQVMMLATGGEHITVALGAALLVVGLLFQPARGFLHRYVNRRFYGIEIEYREDPDTVALARSDAPTALGGLGAFDDLRMIGRGGMAEVYCGRLPGSDREVAIKVLSKAMAAESDEIVQRFQREAEIIADLKHPNIVELLDHGKLPDGTRYIVMEFIQGHDLADLIAAKQRLTPHEAWPFLLDMARALDYAHTQGVIHRDIKPSNVLLDPLDDPDPPRTHRAVLTDFGIAKLTQATALTSTSVVGTLDYIAPEQIQASSNVDGRADVYSMGVMAYQLVTGRRPFYKQNPVAMMLAHLQQPPPDPRKTVPELPDHVADGILRAMAKEPKDRFTTAGELVAALGVGSGGAGGPVEN